MASDRRLTTFIMNTPNESASCGCSTSQPASTGISISALKAALAAAPALPLTVVWTDGEAIEPHFHVTEVGRVQKDFVDCGGTVRRLVTLRPPEDMPHCPAGTSLHRNLTIQRSR